MNKHNSAPILVEKKKLPVRLLSQLVCRRNVTLWLRKLRKCCKEVDFTCALEVANPATDRNMLLG